MRSTHIPKGHLTVVPYFLVPDADAFIQFLKTAFAAQEKEMHRDDDGHVRHAELMIGTASVMLGQSTEQWKDRGSMNYLYVEDTDTLHRRCMDQGCEELYPPSDHDYGVRGSGVKDPWGNTWWLAGPLS